MPDKNSHLVVFQDKKIRRMLHNGEWHFSVVDIVSALTDSDDPRNYWKVLKHRLKEEGSEVVTKCNQLKLLASDGKYYETDCANTKNMFRIIQSIPSKKAEPFKQWLAQVGYERIQEIENPELGTHIINGGRESNNRHNNSEKCARISGMSGNCKRRRRNSS